MISFCSSRLVVLIKLRNIDMVNKSLNYRNCSEWRYMEYYEKVNLFSNWGFNVIPWILHRVWNYFFNGDKIRLLTWD